MERKGLRTLVFNLHRWLGLHLALFFIFMFTTGTILVITDELEAAFHPKIWATAPDQPAPFGDIYNSVTGHFPQAQLFVIERQPQPWLADRSYVTTGWGEDIVVWTDPKTAQVLDVTRAVNFRYILHELHDSLLVSKRPVFVLVAATSLLLLTIILAGLISYRRFWRGLFRWPGREQTPRNRQGGLHRLFAVWVAIFLLIISLSGVFFTLTGLGMTGVIPEPEPATTPLTTIASDQINRAELVAVGAARGFAPLSMVLPRKPTDGIRFAGYTNRAGVLKGATTISVDRTNSKILGIIGPDQFRGNARLTPLMNALHFGQWANPVSRGLWVLFGTLAIALVIAGLKVSVLRQISPQSGKTSGTFRGVLRQLGIFKWAYVALILGIVAVGYVQYGPPSTKWKTLRSDSARADAFRLQLHGVLRRGKSTPLRLQIKNDQIQSVQAVLPGQTDPILAYENGETRGLPDFTALNGAENNRIILMILGPDGPAIEVVYNLGAAIW